MGPTSETPAATRRLIDETRAVIRAEFEKLKVSMRERFAERFAKLEQVTAVPSSHLDDSHPTTHIGLSSAAWTHIPSSAPPSRGPSISPTRGVLAPISTEQNAPTNGATKELEETSIHGLPVNAGITPNPEAPIHPVAAQVDIDATALHHHHHAYRRGITTHFVSVPDAQLHFDIDSIPDAPIHLDESEAFLSELRHGKSTVAMDQRFIDTTTSERQREESIAAFELEEEPFSYSLAVSAACKPEEPFITKELVLIPTPAAAVQTTVVASDTSSSAPTTCSTNSPNIVSSFTAPVPVYTSVNDLFPCPFHAVVTANTKHSNEHSLHYVFNDNTTSVPIAVAPLLLMGISEGSIPFSGDMIWSGQGLKATTVMINEGFMGDIQATEVSMLAIVSVNFHTGVLLSCQSNGAMSISPWPPPKSYVRHIGVIKASEVVLTPKLNSTFGNRRFGYVVSCDTSSIISRRGTLVDSTEPLTSFSVTIRPSVTLIFNFSFSVVHLSESKIRSSADDFWKPPWPYLILQQKCGGSICCGRVAVQDAVAGADKEGATLNDTIMLKKARFKLVGTNLLMSSSHHLYRGQPRVLDVPAANADRVYGLAGTLENADLVVICWTPFLSVEIVLMPRGVPVLWSLDKAVEAQDRSIMAEMRPDPWPSFNLGNICSAWSTCCWIWKPPWPGHQLAGFTSIEMLDATLLRPLEGKLDVKQ